MPREFTYGWPCFAGVSVAGSGSEDAEKDFASVFMLLLIFSRMRWTSSGDTGDDLMPVLWASFFPSAPSRSFVSNNAVRCLSSNTQRKPTLGERNVDGASY